MKKDWIIPESCLDTGVDPRPLRFVFDKSGGNLCISGFCKSGKSLSLLQIAREIKKFHRDATILILVSRNIDGAKFKEVSYEIGLKFDLLTYWQFKKNPIHYNYILCDDVQLISKSVLLEIKKMANQMVVTINPDLKLFEYDPLTQESLLTIEEVRQILSPKEYELNNIYHSSGGSILELAKLLLESSFITPHINSRTCQEVQIGEATCSDEEVLFISKKSEEGHKCGFTSAILLPTNRDIMNYVQALIKQKGKEPWKEVMNKWGKIDYDNLNMYLNSNSINYKCLGSNYGQISNMGHNINIMTYHGSMGFEFDNVFLPYVNSGLYISTNDDISKNVFVLAMTRARHRLYITYSGSLHPYIVLIIDRCRRIRINNETENDNIFTL